MDSEKFVRSELKVFFVKNDILEYVYENGGRPAHFTDQLAKCVDNDRRFRTILLNYGWSKAIREYFPEFEDIMGFRI